MLVPDAMFCGAGSILTNIGGTVLLHHPIVLGIATSHQVWEATLTALRQRGAGDNVLG